MAVRPRTVRCARHGERRRLWFEPLEERRLLSLSHLFTFNDGLANDWIGSAHATLLNGAAVSGGQLVLNNNGVTSGQTGLVQHARLGANVLASGDATVEVWFTAASSSAFTRVFDIGNSLAGVGETYVSFNLEDGFGNSQGLFRAVGAGEISVGGPALDDGSEHMVAIVVDTAADLIRLYIDGSEVGNSALGGATAGGINDALAYLGRSLFDAVPGFTGSINELRIYDDARTTTDIAADATTGPSTATKSPLVRQMEYLDRGIVAVRTSSTSAYIGWRLLGTDPADVAFNLYRSSAGGAPVKLNVAPLTQTTDFVDSTANLSLANAYFVHPIVGGEEQDPSESFTLRAAAPVQQYLNVPLQRPAGGTSPDNVNYTYSANDSSVGDLDGDGDYEIIVKWDPSNAKDNSQFGYTGNVYIDAYDFDGQGNSTLLWRIDLGRNIRAGAHYTQFLVYDLDGDGKAEIALKTAPGTIDGEGNYVLLGQDSPNADYRNSGGHIITGPEYLTVFNGETGSAMATVPFLPDRVNVNQWGDDYGNRAERYLVTAAYLDGERPSLVFGRNYYSPQNGRPARNEITAWDFRDGQLTLRWWFKAGLGINGNINSNYIGQGNHSISVGDVDNDGKDDVIWGSAVINSDGTPRYSTGWGHGDAMHFGDLIPDRPGLEVFKANGDAASPQGIQMRDAETGQTIWAVPSTGSEGAQRALALDIDPRYPGYEAWGSGDPNLDGKLFNAQGTQIASNSGLSTNFGVWWDADLQRELLNGTSISKWNWNTLTTSSIFSASGTSSNNSSKSTPALSADILGDWREEVIFRASNNTALRIYTTTNPATNRIYTLMQDPNYRMAISWQNSAYNQPPHPSFFLGAGMAPPPVPQIYTVQAAPELPGDYNGDFIVDAADYTVWRNAIEGNYDPRADGNSDQMVNEADYTIWKQHYGQSSGGLTIVTNPPAGGMGSVLTTSMLNESTFQDSALAQPSLFILGWPIERSSLSARTAGLAEPAESDQPVATTRNNDLLFALMDSQANEVRATDIDSPADLEGDTTAASAELWAELDEILPPLPLLRP